MAISIQRINVRKVLCKSFLIEFINKYDFPFIANTNTY